MFSTLITCNSLMNNFWTAWTDRRLLKKRFFDFFHKLRHQFFKLFFYVSLSDSTNLAVIKFRSFWNKEILLNLWLFLFNNFRLIILFFKRLVTFGNWLYFIIDLNFSLFWAVLKQWFTWLYRFRLFLLFKSQFLNLLFKRLNSHLII